MVQLEKRLQEQYDTMLALEEMMWFQSQEKKWVKFGNKNTKIFHTQTIIHRWRNKVIFLMIDGIWCFDEETLKREAQTFFKDLFQNKSHCDPPSLILLNILNIGQNLFEVLLQPILLR